MHLSEWLKLIFKLSLVMEHSIMSIVLSHFELQGVHLLGLGLLAKEASSPFGLHHFVDDAKDAAQMLRR